MKERKDGVETRRTLKRKRKEKKQRLLRKSRLTRCAKSCVKRKEKWVQTLSSSD
jgi:hypothetical protein